MLKWEHILILGFRELGSVFVHAPRLFRDTKKHDLTLTTSTYKQNSVPWSQLGLCLHIAFCAYGLWANLAWESPYSEAFPWVRKPVNVTWSEILQRSKQDLNWNTHNWIQTSELHWTASYKRPLPGCIPCLPKAQRKPYRWCCQCRINMPAFWQPQIMQMHVIFIGTYSKTLN